jgi:endonuclease-3
MNRKKQVRDILKRLRIKYPELKTALSFRTPFELLVATVLSAQSTDVQVNKLTANLFKKYRSMKSYANAPLEELQQDVSSVNFYKNKAKNIQNAAKLVVSDFGGKVPMSMDELLTLPGVARKTANIILSGAYGIVEGIAVDTHVIRLWNILGVNGQKDPVKIERDLMDITPKKDWADLSHMLIFHGRETCKARKPNHAECVLYDICPSRGI